MSKIKDLWLNVDVNRKEAQDTALPFTEDGDLSAAIQQVEKWMPSKGMLTRTANVESQYNTHKDTYRAGYTGGAFQVDEIGFNSTKDIKSHPKLKNRHNEIKERFGVDWKDVTWDQLTDPLYSAIAARLIYSNVPEKTPSDREGQAAYWKKYYNTKAGKGSVEHFLEMNKD